MSDVDPEVLTENPDAASNSAPDLDTADTNNGSNVRSTTSDAFGSQEDHEDINPRSPKRQRLSPPSDDIGIDFEAAAARALAISLGVEPPSASPAPATPDINRSGFNDASQLQRTSSAAHSDHQARIANLPALDDSAMQILTYLSKLSHLEIGEMLFGPQSPRGQEYRALKVTFEQAKRMYLTNSPFIIPPAIGFKEAEQVDILRKANMATFMASIFSGEIGLRIMDINFLDVFVPEGGRLLKAQASIYLELKTQAFIAAKRTAPAMLNQVMLDLFPEDMEKNLLSKRPGAKGLAPSELDFLKRLASRRDILYADMRNNRLDGVELRYRWDDFSREVNSYLSKAYDPSGGGKDRDQASPVPARIHLQQDQMESQFSLAQNQGQQMVNTSSLDSNQLDVDFDMDDFMASAARAADMVLQGIDHSGYGPAQASKQVTLSTPSPAPPTRPSMTSESVGRVTPTKPLISTLQEKKEEPTANQTEFQQYKPTSTELTPRADAKNLEDNTSGIPHRSQTAPTQVLYERARLVTTNKALPLPRRPNPPTHRRPWTNEEENALMTGLDQVKGPHWSQILAMYGPGGTINESLKDRNQVQLKDKARNLKLFFLKAGIEVPYYLQAVTGDLKTRAPGQAEKREAKERERNNAEDEDGTVQQDELQTDVADEIEPLPKTTGEQADDSDLYLPQEAKDRSEEDKSATVDDGGDVFDDMEAMIARAAASVTQSLGNP